MTRSLLCAIALASAFSASSAGAAFLASDPVRGATLLLPYFEVDLDSPNGSDTTFRIHNGQSARALVAHVTLWTDWAVPSFGFDVILGAGEQRDIFLREVFNGRIPAPLSPFTMPLAETNGVSFSGCSSSVLDSSTLAHIRAAHTGQESPLSPGECSGIDHGDNIARGFATVDVLGDCAGNSAPNAPSYFGDDGLASNSNVLFGHYAITARGDGAAFGEMLLPIEAADTAFGTTFYGDFADSGGDDMREPFSSTWGASFELGEGLDTDVIVWRDPMQPGEPADCGLAPPWFPLLPADVTMSDPDGNTINIAPAAPFPAATNRVRIGSAELPTIYDAGFLRVEFPLFEVATSSGILSPPVAQGHLTVVRHTALGHASAQRGTDLRVVPSE